MSTNKKAGSLIAGCILKNKKYIVSFFLCATICFILLPVIPLYSIIMKHAYYEDIESKCGRYDLEAEVGGIIAGFGNEKPTGVDSVCYYKTVTCSTRNGHTLNMIFSTSDVEFMTPYKIVNGRFPEKEHEIACESWFLRQYGLSSGEMLGASIKINDTDYSVVGVIVYTGVIIHNNNSSVSFCFSASETEHAYIDLNKKTDPDKFISDNGLSQDTCFRNIDKELAFSESDSSVSSLIIVFVVSLLSAFFVISEVTYFTIEKNRDNIEVLRNNGIFINEIKKILILIFAALLVLAAIVGLFFQFIEKNIFTASVFTQYKGLSKDIGFGSMAVYNAIIWISVSSATLGSVIFVEYRRKFNNRPPKKKSNLKIRKKMFFRIAAQNLRSTPLISIAVSAALTLVLTLMNIVSFWVQTIVINRIDYDDTRYLVTFSPYSIFSEDSTAQKRNIVQSLINDDSLKAEQTGIVYNSVIVDKSVISKEYADYLKMYPDFYASYTNKIKKNVSIPIGITTADSLSESDACKILDISDEKGLILCNPYNFDAPGFVGNVTIALSGPAGDLELTLSDFLVEKNFYTNDVFTVVVVSDSVFAKYSESLAADTVYIHGNISEDYLIHSISDLSMVRIEAIGELREAEDAAVKTVNTILAGLFSITILYSMICMTVSCLLRQELFCKEYAMLNVLGISQKQIFRVPIYEFLMILSLVLILSGLGTWGGASLIILFSDSMVVKRMTPFPIVSFVLSTIILISVSLVFVFISVLSMKRKSSIQCLINR